ncbi:MAG: hypothetical protein KGL15_03970 [Acidobacteriota bacterium]|nr:hypothetical protein [Acidobacteriota bacterium]
MVDANRDRSEWGDFLDQRMAEGLEWARWAVGCWSAFPVKDVPRPLVLVESRVRIEQGFDTVDAKIAFLGGCVEATVSLPDGVIEALGRGAHPSRRPPREPLVIDAANCEEAEFLTDRGPRRLPAWRLSAEHALGAIWVLDPGVTDWRPARDAGVMPPQVQGPGHRGGRRVEVDADDRSVLVHWLGGPPDNERYRRTEVVESDTAVAVVPVGEDVGPPGYRTAVGYVHRVPAVLREPLGARVLVDLNGNPQEAVRKVHSAQSES